MLADCTGFSPYQGQRVALATCHGKERALSRPFGLGLGAQLVVIGCDTDQFGTFSGEVARPADAFRTCSLKAKMGMEQSGLLLGLASEASFGPHPAVPFLASGHEWLVFHDADRDLCVAEQRLEWRTNYSHRTLGPDEDPDAWLRQIGFPAHGVIVRPAAPSAGLLYKGLQSAHQLSAALASCRAADSAGCVWLETDMRAHCNPTRMRSIRRLGIALARRLQTPCPACSSPGWGLLDTQPGLPCSACGAATDLTLVEVWGCQQCGVRSHRPRRDTRLTADPVHCPWCNP